MIPGKRPASKVPRRRRQATREAKLLTNPVKIATIPQKKTSPAIYLAGCIFLMMRLEGVSNN
jgi:hypothetical protein